MTTENKSISPMFTWLGCTSKVVSRFNQYGSIIIDMLYKNFLEMDIVRRLSDRFMLMWK